MKDNRQKIIVDLISKRNIETQEAILDKLHEMGYKATQATISRDIKELNITKIPTGKGGYKYSVPPSQTSPREDSRFISILKETLTGVDCAGNIVMLKTHIGMASAAAVGIESIDGELLGKNKDKILGCIAGDDTIFILVRTEEAAKLLTQEIKTIIGNL